MASSPKKAHRSPVRHEQPPLAGAVVEPPADPAGDVSASALQAAEVLPPVAEPAAAPPAEFLEPPVAEVAEPAVAEFVEPPVAVIAEPPVAEAEPLVAEIAEAPVPEPAQPSLAEIAEPQAPHFPEASAPDEAVAAAASVEPPAAAKDFGGNVRALVEKGLVESRAKFAQVKTVAEETSAAVEASYDAARGGVIAFNVKAIEDLKAGADANFDLVVSLASVKSVSELVALQSEFARKRFEQTSSQAKALVELARKVADETVAPIKTHVAKTFKIAV